MPCKNFDSKSDELFYFIRNLTRRKSFNSKPYSQWNLCFKLRFFSIFGLEKAIMKEQCEEFTTFVCLILGRVCFFACFSFVVGMIMAVMVVLFTLPHHILKTLRKAKYV